MRIGIDCRIYSSSFTGIGRYVHELVENFLKLNEEQNLDHEFVLFFNGPEYQNFKPPNQKVKKVLVNAPHYSLAEQIKFLQIIKKEKCDIVHFPHFNIPYFYRRPYVVTIHDLTLSLFPGRKKTKWYHRLAYNLVIKNAVKKARKIVAVSEHTKEDIVSHLQVDPQKIQVIYHGVSDEFHLITDLKKVERTLEKYQIKKQFLLYTGVLRKHKNLPRLFKAFKILLKEKNLDLNLVITGKPDSYAPEIKETVTKLGLNNDVIFTGLVSEEELVHLYNAALIYVFPSLYEGFGFPPLESMKCGTPVVASNSSSIPEVCGYENALFFDPEDSEDLAAKIEKLYKKPDLQADLIENGLQRVKRFRWQATAEETFELLKKSAYK